MSAGSAHLSTFGAETETEAEIRSTSNLQTTIVKNSLRCSDMVSRASQLGFFGHIFNSQYYGTAL